MFFPLSLYKSAHVHMCVSFTLAKKQKTNHTLLFRSYLFPHSSRSSLLVVFKAVINQSNESIKNQSINHHDGIHF